MNQRQHLLTIRHALDELVNVVLTQPGLGERELVEARSLAAYDTIRSALVELDETELKGYDC